MATASDDGPAGNRGRPGRDAALGLGRSPFTLPNAITAARLLAVVPIVWLVNVGAYAAAFWVFLAAALSDGLDGFIAKRFNSRSVIGTWLDPAADKVLLIGCLLVLVQAELLPGWLLALIIARDVVVSLGACLLHWRSQLFQLEPLMVGKLATLAQILLIGATLAAAGSLGAGEEAVLLLTYAVAVLALLSGAAYLAQGARLVFLAGKA